MRPALSSFSSSLLLKIISFSTCAFFLTAWRRLTQEQAPDCFEQLVSAERFRQVSVEAVGQSAVARSVRECDDGGGGDARRLLVCAQLFEDVPTVKSRHREINEHSVRLFCARHLDSFKPVARFADDIAFLFQHQTQQFPVVCVIVYDQNSTGHGRDQDKDLVSRIYLASRRLSNSLRPSH